MIKKERDSLVTDYSLYCEKEQIYVTAQFWIFIFGATISLTMGIMADIIGRQSVLYVIWFFNLFFMIIWVLTRNMITSILAVGSYIILLDSYFGVGQVMITETMGKKFRGITTSLSFFIYGLGAFLFLGFNAIINQYQDNILIIELSMFIIIIFFYLLGETPFYHYKRKNITYLYKTLGAISDTNNVPEKSKVLRKKLLN